MNTVTHDRSPLLRIELQLRPHPPKDATPLFHGLSDLTFRDADGNVVWDQRLPELTHRSSWSARVELADDDTWVLVLTLLHDKAKRALDAMGLPHFVAEDGNYSFQIGTDQEEGR